jgi:hypothetical protein
MREVMKEVGNARIVTVAKNRLSPEMMLVVTQLTLNVAQLRVELILLLLLGSL